MKGQEAWRVVWRHTVVGPERPTACLCGSDLTSSTLLLLVISSSDCTGSFHCPFTGSSWETQNMLWERCEGMNFYRA